MLSGPELAKAIRDAIAKKKERGSYTITELAAALDMKQPSASELVQTGRLAKAKYMRLVAEFSDVVGPEFWGLPYTAVEVEWVDALRGLPPGIREQWVEYVKGLARSFSDQGAAALDAAAQDSAKLSRPTPATLVKELLQDAASTADMPEPQAGKPSGFKAAPKSDPAETPPDKVPPGKAGRSVRRPSATEPEGRR